MEEAEFTLSSIAEAARQSKRSIQLWADAAVVRAKPTTMLAGSGVHRRFSRTELIIACILSPFAKQKVAIGGLDGISLTVRHLIESHQVVFKRAIEQKGRNYLAVYWAEDKTGGLRICGIDPISDMRGSGASFFDKMVTFDEKISENDRSTPAVKVDVISLNQALRDVPRA